MLPVLLCASASRTAVVLSVLAFMPTVQAEDRVLQRLTLEQACGMAIARSPVLRVRRAQLEQAEGRLQTAKTYPFNPELAVEAARRVSPGVTSTDRGVWVDQEIEIGGQRPRRVAQAEAELAAIRYELRRGEHLLVARVRDAFVEALRARDLLKVEEANAELARSLAEVSRKRFDAGAATQMEVNLALGQAGRAERILRIAQGAYSAARVILAEVVALDPANPPEADGDLTLSPRTLPALAQLLETSLENRADLQAFRKFTEAAQARIDLARRQAVPNLMFGGGVREEGQDRISGGLVGIRIPILNRNRGTIAEATGALHEAAAATDAGAILIRQEVASAFHRYQAGAEAASRFQEQVLSTLQENLRLLRRSFEAGKISWTDVLVFRREFVDIQREAIDTLRDARVAEIELDLASGVMPSVSRPETEP